LFDELGGFDENYSLCSFQDMDLSLRFKHHGYDIAYCPYIQLAQPVLLHKPDDDLLIKQNKDQLIELWKKAEPEILACTT